VGEPLEETSLDTEVRGTLETLQAVGVGGEPAKPPVVPEGCGLPLSEPSFNHNHRLHAAAILNFWRNSKKRWECKPLAAAAIYWATGELGVDKSGC